MLGWAMRTVSGDALGVDTQRLRCFGGVAAYRQGNRRWAVVLAMRLLDAGLRSRCWLAVEWQVDRSDRAGQTVEQGRRHRQNGEINSRVRRAVVAAKVHRMSM
jgi:hypothetical protein